MTAQLIDGKAFAAHLRQQIAAEVSQLKAEHALTPGLAVVLVGMDPASQVYVRNKAKFTREVGMESFEYHLPSETSQEEVLKLVRELNERTEVHGILVQLPLPKHIDSHAVIQTIAPQKDVDGFHVINAGKLMVGQPSLVPCTPLGSLMLLKDVLGGSLSGKDAVVIGRSNIVGKPMSMLLLQQSCTVTLAHSRTVNLPEVVRRADVVVAAVGQPEMVKGDWIKPGAVVIDVGINRVTLPDGSSKLVGDVAFDEALPRAGAITPVPGGVGPMTIACLLRNTLQAACDIHGVAFRLKI